MPSEITLPAGDAREEQAALTAKDEYVPLFPLLADYWDKTLSELPEALQTRVNGRVVKRFIGYRPKFDSNGELARGAEGQYPVWEEVHSEHHEAGDFIVSWDALTPDIRQNIARAKDYQNDPKNEEERTYYWNLIGEKKAIEREIKKWELMHPQSISEAKIQEDKLAELRAKLSEIEQRFELPPDTAAPQAAGKGATVERSITKQQVINAFEGVYFSRPKWNKYLADLKSAPWLGNCWVSPPGVKGSRISRTWNPVLIAAALIDKGITEKQLEAVFFRLQDWADEWNEVSASFRD